MIRIGWYGTWILILILYSCYINPILILHTTLEIWCKITTNFGDVQIFEGKFAEMTENL